MLPLYIEMSQLGWVNTLAALVVPFIAKCFSIYMFRQFFYDIPDDLIEAAAIDGCSPMGTFFKIVVPISKTVYATVFILDFVAHWNDFMWPFLVMTGEDKRTIQLAVQSFFGNKSGSLQRHYGGPGCFCDPNDHHVHLHAEILCGRYCFFRN